MRRHPSHTTGRTGPVSGGSTGLSFIRNIKSRESERVEVVVAQCLLNRRRTCPPRTSRLCRSTPRPGEWRLIEWPTDEPEPTKYFLSTLPATISRRALANATKLRWRIERDLISVAAPLGLLRPLSRRRRA